MTEKGVKVWFSRVWKWKAHILGLIFFPCKNWRFKFHFLIKTARKIVHIEKTFFWRKFSWDSTISKIEKILSKIWFIPTSKIFKSKIKQFQQKSKYCVFSWLLSSPLKNFWVWSSLQTFPQWGWWFQEMSIQEIENYKTLLSFFALSYYLFAILR